MGEERTQTDIHAKGFNVNSGARYPSDITEYNNIKIGTKTLEDASIYLRDPSMRRMSNFRKYDKSAVLTAIAKRDIEMLRDISKYFYETDGIYSRVCNYFAYMYRYDWYVVPEIFDESEKNLKKVKTDFSELLNFLDNSHIKKVCGDIALEVVKTGVYYGYLVPGDNNIVIQQLPSKYCRSRFSIADIPVIEFNMSFFDACFKESGMRMKVLKLFPKDFQKGYALYKQGKLDPDYSGELQGCWYTLEPGSAVKFSLNGNSGIPGEIPIFINAIPSLIDLDKTQGIERQKLMQQLQKILIQELPRDKNGDLIFDVDEARDIHQNAKEMVSNAVGVDVLTTFADISVEDIADDTSTDDDTLEDATSQVYNDLGVSELLFNSDSSAALEKSIRVDASIMRQLLLQFSALFDTITKSLDKNRKKHSFSFHMLETTQYNYDTISETYRKQVSMGYSKLLPQVALGHSQSEVLNTAVFENKVLKLYEVMIPPLQSSTMSPEQILGTDTSSSSSGSSSKTSSSSSSSDSSSSSSSSGTKTTTKTTDPAEEKSVGRPEKSTEDKSEKTIANIESA